jgi:hypothetical protein
MRTLRTYAILGILLASVTMTGCFPHMVHPFSMGFATPVPVPAWVPERMEEKYCFKDDHRTAILPPIRPGFPPPLCEDPPSEEQVLRTMIHVKRGVPYLVEEFRDNVDIKFERIVDKIDPPRFFPLVGPAQLHHCHWRCLVSFTETIESGYPFPFRCRRPRMEVIYIDKDHLHLYPCGGPASEQSIAGDLAGQ